MTAPTSIVRVNASSDRGRSVDHLVAVHQVAAARRAAGRPIWVHTINLGEVLRNESLTFLERRDKIVEILRASAWVRAAEEHSDLEDAVWRLGEVENADDFDCTWDEIYDLADFDRVWIDLHR